MKRIASLIILCSLLTACAPKAASENARSDFVLGTVCTVRLLSGGSDKTLDEIFARLQQIDDRMSANKEGSEIAAINASAGGKPVVVTADLFSVIARALDYAKRSNGAFDPTVGPLVKLWNIGNEGAHVPLKPEIAKLLALVNWKDVEMNAAASSVRLLRAGMGIDLGAIAKGYAADECARILAAHKVKAAIVDLGGNILVYGKKTDGKPWRIGVQNPDKERGDYIGIVTGTGITVVTSGIYERFFIQDGTRYHHILDTKTGFPVDNGLESVTIIAETSIDADALSTSVFALGLKKGMELVKNTRGVEAVFIDAQKNVYISPGATTMFEITNKAYTLKELPL